MLYGVIVDFEGVHKVVHVVLFRRFRAVADPLCLPFPAYFTNEDPESAEKVTDIYNNNGQFNDLENLTSHYLACDDYDVRMDVVSLQWVVLYDSGDVPSNIVFVQFHEPLHIEYFKTTEQSYHFNKVKVGRIECPNFEILRSRDQSNKIQDEFIFKISCGDQLQVSNRQRTIIVVVLHEEIQQHCKSKEGLKKQHWAKNICLVLMIVERGHRGVVV